jgi:uncharacterized membrane protein YkoI
MRNGALISTRVGLALVIATGVCQGSEKPINYSDLPPAVRETAEKQSRGAIVEGYWKSMDNGRTEYEVETMVNGKSRDISIDPSGKVIEVEQEISLDAVPAAAMAAIQKEAKGGSIQKIEEVKSDSETAYEAQILRHIKHREVRVHADGSVAPEQN